MKAPFPKMLKWLVILTSVYGVLFLLVQLMETGMLYHPTNSRTSDEALRAIDIERHRITTPDGTQIDVWYAPGDSLTFLLCHGNAGSNDDRLDQMRLLRKYGHGVVLFDYRGYGKSSGRPTERGLYEDAFSVYTWMTKKIEEKFITLYGTSLGAAVAAQLASKTHPRALILETAMMSKLDLGRDLLPFFPAFLFTWNQYETAHYLKSVAVPVLITHGTEDEVIPYRHGQALFQRAGEPRFFLPVSGAHHNDIWFIGGNPYFDAIHQFTVSRAL